MFNACKGWSAPVAVADDDERRWLRNMLIYLVPCQLNLETKKHKN